MKKGSTESQNYSKAFLKLKKRTKKDILNYWKTSKLRKYLPKRASQFGYAGIAVTCILAKALQKHAQFALTLKPFLKFAQPTTKKITLALRCFARDFFMEL
jgi:hypothetical protein